MKSATLLVTIALLLHCFVLFAEGRGFGFLSNSLAVHKADASKTTRNKHSSGKKSSKGIDKKQSKGDKLSSRATGSGDATGKKTKAAHGAVSKSKKKIRVVPAELTDEERASIARRQQIFTTAQQLILSLGSMYCSRKIYKIDYSMPGNVLLARVVFTAYIIFSLLLGWFLRLLVEKTDDDTVLPRPVSPAGAGGPLGGILGQLTGAGSADKAESDDDEVLTVKKHDLKAIAELNRSILFEMVAAIYLHFTQSYKFMLMLPMMGAVSKLKNPIVMLHLYGMHAVGELERPFKNPMQKMMEGMANPDGDAAASTSPSVVVDDEDADDDIDDGDVGLEVVEEVDEDEYYDAEDGEREEGEELYEDGDEYGDAAGEGDEEMDEEAELMEAMEAIMNLADSLEDEMDM